MRKSLPLIVFALLLLATAPVWAGDSMTASETPAVVGGESSPSTASGPAVDVSLEPLFTDQALDQKHETAHCPAGTAPSCHNVEGSTCSGEGSWRECYESGWCEWFLCFCTNGQWDCEYP